MVNSRSAPASPLTSVSSDEERNPIRPVERQSMKDWLMNLLDNGSVPTLSWTDRDQGEFKIGWCHGSRQGWNPSHADLFSLYAKHTGRFIGYEKDPKKWKANFRCALNSLKDVKEMTEKSNKKGGNAYKIFKLLKSGQRTGGKRKSTRSMKRPGSVGKRNTRTCVSSSSEEDYKVPSVFSPSSTDGSIGSPLSPVEVKPLMYHSEPVSPITVRPSSIQAKEEKYSDVTCRLTSLPNFDAISPGLGGDIEYGKMHSLPLHNSGFTILPGKGLNKNTSHPLSTQHTPMELSSSNISLESDECQSPDRLMGGEYNLIVVEVESSDCQDIVSELEGIDGIHTFIGQRTASMQDSDHSMSEWSTHAQQ